MEKYKSNPTESIMPDKGSYPGRSEQAWTKCVADYGKESDIKQSNTCTVNTYNGNEYHTPMRKR